MKIYIEFIIILIPIIFYFFYKIWEWFSKKRLLKKYTPDNDKSRKGGVYNEREIATTKQGIDPELINLVGHEQPKGERILQETVVDDVGKNSNVARKNSSSVRKLLGRNKK